MADVEFDDFDDGYAAPAAGRMGRVLQLAGAACSVALIVGVAVWGYKLAVRDVTGIPVVRALSEPMRIAPANPGGEEAMHQGLSVNAVAAAGTVSPLPETVALAPPEMGLAEEDVAGLAAPEQPAAGDAVIASSPASADAVAAPVARLEMTAVADGSSTAVVTEVSAALAPAEISEEDAVAAALASALSEAPVTDPALADGIGASITSTPRPHLRPSSDASVDPLTAEAAAAVVAPVIDPATIPIGTRMAQLGAFDDELAARAEWAKLEAGFPSAMSGKSMVIQAAQSGGRTFYRLRAHGFASEEDARSFCAELLANNASCIPVAQR